jgi:hypothetical protein
MASFPTMESQRLAPSDPKLPHGIPLLVASSREIDWMTQGSMPVVVTKTARMMRSKLAPTGVAMAFTPETAVISYVPRYYVLEQTLDAAEIEMWRIYNGLDALWLPLIISL